MKRPCIFLAAAIAAAAGFSAGVEEHADRVISDVLASVAKLKAADPKAVPMAFWDFDGTIVKGDITTGWVGGREVYPGLFRACAEAGYSATVRTPADVDAFLGDTYSKLKSVGRFVAWPALGQVFAGAVEAELEGFCRRHAEKTFRPWVFASSEKILRALDKAGVENYIVSGSPDIFVKGASVCAGVPRSRSVGIRQRIAGGRLTAQLEYPQSMNEGKVENVREIVNACPHAYAVAAFGNSYWTDGPFMRYVATNPLPGGAKGVALMVNGGEAPAEYRGFFICAEQDATIGGR